MNIDRTKAWFWVLLNVLILALIINVFFFVMPTLDKLGRSFAPTHAITVSAQGKTTAIPDIAETSFSIVAQGTDPNALANENNEKMNAVIKFVKGKGVDEKDIQTTGYNLQPNYSYDRNTGKSSIFGYTLTQSVSVKIRDFSRIGDILAGLTPLGVNQVSGPNFTIDDPEKYMALARADAIAKVQKQASDMVRAAGASLGEIVTISESGQPYPIYYGAKAYGLGGADSAAVPPSPVVQPGSQDVTDTVTITYALR
jgi:hypothetical protein